MSISEIIRYVYVTIGISLIFFVPLICVRNKFFSKRNEGSHWKYELTDLVFIFYIICLYQITALRFGGIGWSFENMVERQTRVNAIPLVILWQWVEKGVWWHLFYNVVGNCIWFVPLGVLLPAIYRSYRKHLGRTVFIGLMVSTSIEILQFVLCTGVTDIDDVIFNTFGTAMGYLIWTIIDFVRIFIKKQIKKRKDSLD